MGCDWFFPYVVFGYTIPTNAGSYSRTYNKLIHMCEFPTPFELHGILEEFPAENRDESLNDSATLVLGFIPPSDASLHTLADALKMYIESTPILKDLINTSITPKFYTGIAWTDYIDPEDISEDESEDDSEYEDASDDEDDDDDEDDESEEEEN